MCTIVGDVRKLNTVEQVTDLEEIRSLARNNYELPPASTASSSTGTLPSVTVLGGSPTSRTGSRKRVKDTSGEEASPHTVKARSVIKHALGAKGRRLTYSTLGNEQYTCKIHSICKNQNVLVNLSRGNFLVHLRQRKATLRLHFPSRLTEPMCLQWVGTNR